jgi:hypothetical protein
MRFVRLVTKTRHPGRDGLAHFPEKIVRLPRRAANLDHGIDESRRPNDLLRRDSFGTTKILVARGRRHVDRLSKALLELLGGERSIVDGGRKSKSVFDEIVFPGAIAAVHPAELRHRHMTFVDEDDEVFGEVVDERRRRKPRTASVEMTTVVLDSGTVPEFRQKFEVEPRAHFETLRFEEFAPP